MKTEIVRIDPSRLDGAEERRAIARAGEILKKGGLVAFPTETVYGLGGNAFDADASRKIYAAKGRPSDNPLIVHIARREDLAAVAEDIPRQAEILADHFWPGPLTMILKKRPEIPRETTGGLDTVAVRFPSHPVARELILSGDGFIAAPSANASGRPSPTLAAHCIEDLDGRVDMIIDGGEVGIGVESSILDLTDASGMPTILRPGYITAEMLTEILGQVRTDPGLKEADVRPKAPGMKYRHYAPKGQLTLYRGDGAAADRILADAVRMLADSVRVGVIAADETAGLYEGQGIPVYPIGSRMHPEEIAHNLFRVLRQCDADGIEEILSETFTEGALGEALMNRLEKASGHRIV